MLSITGPDVSFWDKDQRKSIHIGEGRHITLIYENLGNGKREISLDGVKAKACFDPLMQTEKLFIPTEKLTDGMVITVTD